jgi:hypothetical protein
MAVTSATGLGRPRRWAAGLAWGLWALAMLGLAVAPWMDSLLRQAGRPDLVVLVPGNIVRWRTVKATSEWPGSMV